MRKQTPLYAEHLKLNARMVDFAGWDMPLHYGSQLEEHHAVRQHAGIFDVSHMNVMDVEGKDALSYLRYLLANDVAKLKVGQALYTCMLNANGGVVDDLIAYYIADQHYRLVLNAGTQEKDNTWLEAHTTGFSVTLVSREDLAMIALQGPHALAIGPRVFNGALANDIKACQPFHFVQDASFMVARTGYTGEDGVEIFLPAAQAGEMWHALHKAGACPIGLGARDSLRLEAGLNLYGNEMDETVSPLSSNLGWTVAFDPSTRDFIGKEALLKTQEAGVTSKLVGLVLAAGGILRHGQTVYAGEQRIGVVTSGGFSPTSNQSIALARIDILDFTQITVDVRGKRQAVQVTKPVFVRKGKVLV